MLFGSREDGVLTTKHDAARVHWGGEWRMPSDQEVRDLCEKCDWSWTSVNGVNGYSVRGSGAYASARIFLPCAGYCYGTLLFYAGSGGGYWSSVPYSGSNYDNACAWGLDFDSSYHGSYYHDRSYGRSVRPVQGFTK